MSRGSDREAVGTSREGFLHIRRAGAFKALCGVGVPTTWFAWSIEVFQHARTRCDGCAAVAGLSTRKAEAA